LQLRRKLVKIINLSATEKKLAKFAYQNKEKAGKKHVGKF
jgi:hypothetical protein